MPASPLRSRNRGTGWKSPGPGRLIISSAGNGSPKSAGSDRATGCFHRPQSRPKSEPESSLLDVVDSVLNKGAVVHGELILGVANVDLIYAKLSVLLAALDRVVEPVSGRKPKRRRKKVESRK